MHPRGRDLAQGRNHQKPNQFSAFLSQMYCKYIVEEEDIYIGHSGAENFSDGIL